MKKLTALIATVLAVVCVPSFASDDDEKGASLQTKTSAATTNSGLYIDGTGRVGVGTDTPNRLFHVQADNGTARLDVQEVGATPATRLMFVILNNGTPSFRLQNTQNAGKIWDMSGRLDRYVFRDVLDGVDRLSIRQNGNVEAQLFVNTSSRAAKHGFKTIDPLLVLQSVVSLPLTEWSYKGDRGAARHLGPVAEDFHAEFGLGSDDKHIAASDTAGVALVAIQGLHQKLVKRDDTIDELKSDRERLLDLIGALESRVVALEQSGAEN